MVDEIIFTPTLIEPLKAGNNPRVGIVIPVYNRRVELSALLESLAKLEYRDFDVLVVDNGSSENIMDIRSDVQFEVLSFSSNFGAIRGFNGGTRHLVQRNLYQYIWLLDSDLTVHEAALTNAVRIMEADRSLGICVSIIYNINNKDLIVEAGGRIDLKHGRVEAIFGNERRRHIPETLDVDYASCGMSLLRVEMIRQIGLYDERYHFLWEDMDYGIYARKNGWKVVVASGSEVYHPPFTEKRNPNIYAYYDVRNPLLTVAKYTSGLQLPHFLFFNLFRYLRIALLSLMSGVKGFARLTFNAIFDFIAMRLGKAELIEIIPVMPIVGDVDLSSEKRIFIIGTGGRDVVESLVSVIRSCSSAEVALVVQCCRKAIFEGIDVDLTITYDDHASNVLQEYLRAGIALIRQGGCVVNTDLKVTSPLVYFGRRVFDWDQYTKQLFRSRNNMFSIWKPAVAVVLGVVLALIILPMVWIAALKHKLIDLDNH